MDTSELHLSDLAGNFMELEEPARIVLLPSLIESKFHHFIFTLRQIALYIISMFKHLRDSILESSYLSSFERSTFYLSRRKF